VAFRMNLVTEVARPTGFEPVAFGSGGRAKEATRGGVEPLPLILLVFSYTRDHPPRPRAATDCQSFVSQIETELLSCQSRGVRSDGTDASGVTRARRVR